MKELAERQENQFSLTTSAARRVFFGGFDDNKKDDSILPQSNQVSVLYYPKNKQDYYANGVVVGGCSFSCHIVLFYAIINQQRPWTMNASQEQEAPGTPTSLRDDASSSIAELLRVATQSEEASDPYIDLTPLTPVFLSYSASNGTPSSSHKALTEENGENIPPTTTPARLGQRGSTPRPGTLTTSSSPLTTTSSQNQLGAAESPKKTPDRYYIPTPTGILKPPYRALGGGDNSTCPSNASTATVASASEGKPPLLPSSSRSGKDAPSQSENDEESLSLNSLQMILPFMRSRTSIEERYAVLKQKHSEEPSIHAAPSIHATYTKMSEATPLINNLTIRPDPPTYRPDPPASVDGDSLFEGLEGTPPSKKTNPNDLHPTPNPKKDVDRPLETIAESSFPQAETTSSSGLEPTPLLNHKKLVTTVPIKSLLGTLPSSPGTKDDTVDFAPPESSFPENGKPKATPPMRVQLTMTHRLDCAPILGKTTPKKLDPTPSKEFVEEPLTPVPYWTGCAAIPQRHPVDPTPSKTAVTETNGASKMSETFMTDESDWDYLPMQEIDVITKLPKTSLAPKNRNGAGFMSCVTPRLACMQSPGSLPSTMAGVASDISALESPDMRLDNGMPAEHLLQGNEEGEGVEQELLPELPNLKEPSTSLGGCLEPAPKAPLDLQEANILPEIGEEVETEDKEKPVGEPAENPTVSPTEKMQPVSLKEHLEPAPPTENLEPSSPHAAISKSSHDSFESSGQDSEEFELKKASLIEEAPSFDEPEAPSFDEASPENLEAYINQELPYDEESSMDRYTHPPSTHDSLQIVRRTSSRLPRLTPQVWGIFFNSKEPTPSPRTQPIPSNKKGQSVTNNAAEDPSKESSPQDNCSKCWSKWWRRLVLLVVVIVVLLVVLVTLHIKRVLGSPSSTNPNALIGDNNISYPCDGVPNPGTVNNKQVTLRPTIKPRTIQSSAPSSMPSTLELTTTHPVGPQPSLGNMIVLDDGSTFQYRWYSNHKGLNVNIISSLDNYWNALFLNSEKDWSQSTFLHLTTAQESHRLVCEPIFGVLKLCNGNYTTATWRGRTEVFVQGNTIVAAVVMFNDLLSSTNAMDQYTVCHELGHAFGLGPSHSNNCMAMLSSGQSPPQHPDQSNFNMLQAVYAATRRLLYPGTTETRLRANFRGRSDAQ